MEITLEEIRKKFGELPEDLQWAIVAAKVDDNIVEIGKNRGLNVAQMGQLSLETHAVMLGFTLLDKFEESVEGGLGLPKDKIRLIVSDVNEKILRNIRKNMMAESPQKPTEQRGETEDKIMKSAGIEITPATPIPDLSIPELNSGNREEILKKIERPELIQKEPAHPITEQKFAGAFKIPGTKTEYSAENVSNNNPPSPKATKEGDKNVDPYREIPE